jgi:hypothetical protein
LAENRFPTELWFNRKYAHPQILPQNYTIEKSKELLFSFLNETLIVNNLVF